jgi:uncharacterized protein
VFSVTATDDASEALRRAGHHLTARPVEHNLVLSLLHQRVASPEAGRYWTVLRGGEVVGFGMQSPRTLRALLTPMSRGATDALAGAVAAEPDTALPGVTAEAGTAAAFAGRWSELVPAPVTPEEGQRLYRLGSPRPAAEVPGRLRPAGEQDRDLMVSWRAAFHTDVRFHSADPAAVARDIRAGQVFVWDDDGPAGTARATAGVAGVSRIGFVYTPPERRRRGYAAACVAALADRLRRGEGLDCVLYTQLDNPTSNGIYRRLGFDAVAEVLSYRFAT